MPKNTMQKKIMQKIYTTIALGAVIAGVSLTPLSAFQGQASDNSTQSGAMSALSPDQVVQRLGDKLQLTDDQKAKITPIIADRQEKLKSLQADTSERKMKKARKMKGILEDSDKKITALLTATQKKQYDELKQQRQQIIRDRMQGNGPQE
jgi:Spy/CpxP family protein refolding chaperone